jgi:hypothetical protein
MGDFQSETTHSARRPHRCAFCRCAIPSGGIYLKITGRWQGDFYSDKGHTDCRELWNSIYNQWADDWDGMVFDITEVFTDSGEVEAAQDTLNKHRGFFPHAVNRVEFRLRKWLAAPGGKDE